MRTNYVLIDYENVQPENLAALDHEFFKVIVFVGANQAKVTLKAATALQKMGDRAKYIPISGNGRDALDFHIAYYIGRLSVEDPGAYFHIISKDQGFKPLIAHLMTQNIFAALSKDISDLPPVRAATPKSVEERRAIVLERFKTMNTTRPATVRTLQSTINRVFFQQLSPEDIDALVKRLQSKGDLTISGTKVQYPAQK